MSERLDDHTALNLEDRIAGAKITAITQLDLRSFKVEFEHRGTDDDSGYFLVDLGDIFLDGVPQ